MRNNYLVLDIETAPNRYDEYTAAFPGSKKKPGLHAIISEVVCICLADSGEEITTMDRQDYTSEEEILSDLQEVLWENNTTTLVGFNVKAFDLPFLAVRAMMYNIRLALPDLRSKRVVDIYSDYPLGGKWQSDVSSCSLRELMWAKYHKIPATASGSEVAGLYAAGRLGEIAAHCREDVQDTKRLYLDMY